MQRLYFIRHGESEGNSSFIYASRTHVPLTVLGRKQAESGGRQAREDSLHIDVMLVSPLRRAQETADVIAPFLDNPPRESCDAIMERDFSPLDGTSYRDRTYETYVALDSIPGIETTAELHTRAERVLTDLQKRPEVNILLVSHSAFGRALQRVVEGKPWQHEYIKDGDTSLPHAEVIRFV